MSSLALGAIGLYRRHLSPLKGYRCAHRALHGHGSCSDFGLRAYGRHTFATATALMVRRLVDCRRAYAIYLAQTSDEAEENEPATRKSKSPELCHPLDVLNCMNWGSVPDAACSSINVCDCLGGLSL